MEKKKLLLVAISTGLFLVIAIGAAIAVFAPGNTGASSGTTQTRRSGVQTVISAAPSSSQPPAASLINVSETGSPEPFEPVRANENIPSPQPFLTGTYNRETSSNVNGSSLVTPEVITEATPETTPGIVPRVVPEPETLISVQRPSSAAVPNTAPTGRAAAAVTSPGSTTAANRGSSAPAPSSAPAAVSAPTTASAPAGTPASTGRSSTAGTPATASTPTATSAPVAASTAPVTASAPAATSVPAAANTAPVTASTAPAAAATITGTSAATSTASTTTADSASIPATVQAASAQTRVHNDFWIQTGAFSTVTRAEAVKDSLASKGIVSLIENHQMEGRTIFRVRVGPYTSLNEANYWLYLIQSIDGFEDSQVRQTPRQG